MTTEKTGLETIEELKVSRPDIVVTVTRELDPYFVWDGDGPNPEEDGFSAYTVDVNARTIRNGEIIIGGSSLGGSYYLDDEPIGEIHGYLPQMIAEAIEEMDEQLHSR